MRVKNMAASRSGLNSIYLQRLEALVKLSINKQKTHLPFKDVDAYKLYYAVKSYTNAYRVAGQHVPQHKNTFLPQKVPAPITEIYDDIIGGVFEDRQWREKSSFFGSELSDFEVKNHRDEILRQLNNTLETSLEK